MSNCNGVYYTKGSAGSCDRRVVEGQLPEEICDVQVEACLVNRHQQSKMRGGKSVPRWGKQALPAPVQSKKLGGRSEAGEGNRLKGFESQAEGAGI